VSKNTIVAFVLILLTVLFFQSRFYYERILKQPYPYDRKASTEVAQPDTAGTPTTPLERADTTAAARAGTKEVPSEMDSSVVESSQTGASDTIWVETPQSIVGISTRGAKIVSVKMKEYAYRAGVVKETEDSLIELVPSGEPGGAGIAIDGHSLDSVSFSVESGGADTLRVAAGEGEEISVALSTTWEGRKLTKTFRFGDDPYYVGIEMSALGLAGRMVSMQWEAGITESEFTGEAGSVQQDPRKVHLFDGKDVEHLHLKRVVVEERTGTYEWVGLTSKYFLIALMGPKGGDADVRVRSFGDTVTRALPKVADNNYAISMSRQCGENSCSFGMYLGPMRLNALRETEAGLQRVLYTGWRWFFFADKWFPALCEVMLRVLLGLERVFRDYGVAIILLTVVVKLVTYPMVTSSMKSMGRMRDLQPKINALRQRYKSDARKMNEELMELYRKEGVNPFNPGCLPMFLQMPILFSLYVVLRKAIELRGASTVLLPWVTDLSQEEVLFGLPWEVPWYGSNFALLPVIMGIVTFVQNKKTMKDPNQVAMVYVMPIMMLVLFNKFPAGLVLYWTLSSAIGLGQQYLMERRQATRAVTVVVPVKSTGGKKRKGQ
jgi:YidC/Oxa1 family membrane protein insertase